MKRKRLFDKPSSSSTQLPKWIELEERSLVSRLMLYTKGEDWVAHKDRRFWDQAGQFAHEQAKTSHCWSGEYNYYCICMEFKCYMCVWFSV